MAAAVGVDDRMLIRQHPLECKLGAPVRKLGVRRCRDCPRDRLAVEAVEDGREVAVKCQDVVYIQKMTNREGSRML